ncbi:hypothetical protein GTP56_06055 [Duganella sp. FT134W]|uniref:Uncharacterized protein n=1 Tax=Duganella margarita TaxID=2692170 RepID=A0A7X4GYY4_9BURK|nr:hypothetical protein [Duganella margarita]MYM71761.1 hypothetical protein [Duganella margarita]
MVFKGLFVDDLDDIYATLLSSNGEEGLQIMHLKLDEAATLAGQIFDSQPDLVALDFRLDENPEAIDPQKSYNGSGLAQLLRDKTSVSPEYDFPIVLISGEDKLERFYRPDGTAHDLFDRIYKKDEVANTQDVAKAQLVSLCKGYVALKAVWDRGDERLSVLGLNAAELPIVFNQELRAAILNAGAPHIAARTLLKGVIDRPGILLSDNELAARLGVTSIEPLIQKLGEQHIQYKGIFHEGWRRWWAHRLDEWAMGVLKARPTTLTGTVRAQKLRDELGVAVEPAYSTWNKSSDERFAFSCCVCDRAGEIRHSVAAFDPQTPKYSIRKRICWDCIQTGRNNDKKIEVDEVDANLAAEVMDKPRENDASA